MELSKNRLNYSMAFSPEKLVGRNEEQKAICDAIRRGVQVIYIEGEGGIGKTRLLTEVNDDNIIKALSFRTVVLCIVDFYDTAMHSGVALEDTLAKRITRQSNNEYLFKAFFDLLEKYRAGHSKEADVHTAFKEAFNTWIEDKWAILRFDTAESLEYGRDAPEVLKECDVSGNDTSVVTWIQENLPALNHATALIAGRPTHTLYNDLQRVYSEDKWLYLRLETLSLEESHEYFKASVYGSDVDEETIERIWLLTNGRPILISLAIDWLYSGLNLDEIYDIDIEHLRDQKSSKWQEQHEQFEKAMIGKLRLLNTPMNAAVYYVARARKGFNTEILRKMLKELSLQSIDLTETAVSDLMENLVKLSFVKHPFGAREGWFFLHDEMYDLTDKYVWEPDYPGYTHQAETAKFLAEQVYGEENGIIATITKQLADAETHTHMTKARRDLDILRTEQLFYLLEAEPKQGYLEYERLDTQAMSQQNREWDDMLRTEMLRFIHSMPRRAQQGGLVKEFNLQKRDVIAADQINQDARADWVHRFLARGEVKHAERVARKLLEQHPYWKGFWKAKILVSLGGALVRQGKPESTVALKEALCIMEQLQPTENLLWYYSATAYLYLGLRARAEWNLRQAVENYERAQELFDKNNDYIGVARSLNNLAYIQVKQGNYQEAVQNAQQAVNMRDQFGDVIGKALSLNTLAIAIDRSGNPVRAERLAWDALHQLQVAKDRGHPNLDREVGMVYINLGRIQRHKVRKDQFKLVEGLKADWLHAEKYLKKAQELEKSLEPQYQYDLYNQMGLLYSNWANWLVMRQLRDKELYFKLMDIGAEYFKKADQYSKKHDLFVDRADNLEDWAWIFHLQRAYRNILEDDTDHIILKNKVFNCLNQAEELALNSIGSQEQAGLQAYYILGNIYHQRGRFIHKFENNYIKALKEYALSVAYYDQFALNPYDPLERKEHLLHHIRSRLNDMLGSSPIEQTKMEQVKQVREEMLKAVEDKKLPSKELRKWMDNCIAFLSRG